MSRNAFGRQPGVVERQMKGVVVACAVKALRTWLRHQPVSPELGLTPGAESLLGETTILSSSWYDYDEYLELMRALHEHALGSCDEKLARLVAAGAPLVYGGAHRLLIKMGDPVSTLSGIGLLWSTCHSFGTPSATAAPGTARVEFAGVPDMGRLEGIINASWVGGILRVAGAKGVRHEIESGPWEGSATLAVAYRWDSPGVDSSGG